MIYISHRGNIDGVDPTRENRLDYIEDAIGMGFDCEIDLRIKNGEPHLGHDTPDYRVTAEWLKENKNRLWIHVKEYAALVWLMEHCPHCTFFCHESDKFTLVSNGWVWSHDLTNPMTEKCVIPLLSKESVISYEQTGFGAVCSDYLLDCVKKFGR